MNYTVSSVQAGGFRKVRSTDSTNTGGFEARVPTVTKPASAGVVGFSTSLFDFGGVGEPMPDLIEFMPYGNANNATFDVRILGWRYTGTIWIYKILLQFTATCGNIPGVAATDLTNAQFLADTVSDPATGMGEKGVDAFPASPANDTPASYRLKTRGYSLLEFLFNRGTAASCNGFYVKH